MARENTASAMRTLAGFLGRPSSRKKSQHVRDMVEASVKKFGCDNYVSDQWSFKRKHNKILSNDAPKYERDDGSTQEASSKNPILTSKDLGHRVRILQEKREDKKRTSTSRVGMRTEDNRCYKSKITYTWKYIEIYGSLRGNFKIVRVTPSSVGVKLTEREARSLLY